MSSKFEKAFGAISTRSSQSKTSKPIFNGVEGRKTPWKDAAGHGNENFISERSTEAFGPLDSTPNRAFFRERQHQYPHRHMKRQDEDSSMSQVGGFRSAAMTRPGRRSRENLMVARLARRLNGFDVIPVEQMYDLPTLPASYLSKLNRVDLAALRAFQMPVFPWQLRYSLEREFPEMTVRRTNWRLFDNSSNASGYSILMAQKMVAQRLYYRHLKCLKRESDRALNLDSVVPYDDLASASQVSDRQLIKDESDALWRDIKQPSSYQNYTGNGLVELTFPKGQHLQLSPECQDALQHAAKAVGKNATMHPFLKSDALKIIYNVFTFGANTSNP